MIIVMQHCDRCMFSKYIVAVYEFSDVMHSTAGAMQGKTSYKSSLEARLNIFRPSRDAVDQFVVTHPPAFTPKVE